MVAGTLVLDESVTNVFETAISFAAAFLLLAALAATVLIFRRSAVVQKHNSGVKVVLLLGVLAYWAIFGLTLFMWRFG
jgi:hypothetical protein